MHKSKKTIHWAVLIAWSVLTGAVVLGQQLLPDLIQWTAGLMPKASLILPLAGMLAVSGFVSGLTGFGFSAVGVVILWLLSPDRAIPLLMMLSLANQFYSFWLINAAESRNGVVAESPATPPAPSTHLFIVGGVIGVPFGVWLLDILPVKPMVLMIGAVLLAYAMWALFKPRLVKRRFNSLSAQWLTGAVGGVIGGFTAFPGSALIVWSSLQGLSKAQQRRVVQPFIMAMQLLSLFAMALGTQLLNLETLVMFICLCPFVLCSTALGVVLFKRTSDQGFQRLVIVLLTFSSVSMIIKSLF